MLFNAGSMLVVPAGVSKAPESAGFMHVAYIYARGVWNAPLIQIPAASKVGASSYKERGIHTAKQQVNVTERKAVVC